MRVLPACVYMCHICVSAYDGPKRISGPLELELWMVMNHYVNPRKQTQVLFKSNRCC